jgi:hypothetical protein
VILLCACPLDGSTFHSKESTCGGFTSRDHLHKPAPSSRSLPLTAHVKHEQVGSLDIRLSPGKIKFLSECECPLPLLRPVHLLTTVDHIRDPRPATACVWTPELRNCLTPLQGQRYHLHLSLWECKAINMIKFLFAFCLSDGCKGVPVCNEELSKRAFKKVKEIAKRGDTILETELSKL